MHEARYVTGLSKWMEDHQLPVGAYITLERSAANDEVIVDYRTRRPKREWARISIADLAHARLLFEMNKINVACEYDEHMIVAEQNAVELDQLRAEIGRLEVTLSELVDQIAPELLKLNPQGTVHAKSVYSAVNVVRRVPPGPVFHALLSNRRFRDMGNGLFALT